ncbi:ribosomal RNA large subunit methyltransferase F-like protein [Gautieria morchelliformis]|nr:ribosomal RNA large subunit methyltransferase F-like protein [Gautieria morchelliformis]
MHPRNPYKHSPDFGSLAEFFPPLKGYLSLSPSGKYSLDFRHPEAQLQALLKRDFNVTISLPKHRLCPPVPNRLNYVLWVQDILFPYDVVSPDKEIRGLDIGTGASAIYPLLACSLPNAEQWTFVGTDNDPLSANYASRNVEANNLGHRITIWPIQKFPNTGMPVTEEDPRSTPILAPLVEDTESRFDFTMCNPPFYASISEIEKSAEAKDLPPIAICTGADTEMITPGGETRFVLQMLQESAREDVRGQCRWYTSMLGKLSSVGEVVTELRHLNIDNYALTQFIQGTTRRWAVAWSFGDDRLPDVSRIGTPTWEQLHLKL